MKLNRHNVLRDVPLVVVQCIGVVNWSRQLTQLSSADYSSCRDCYDPYFHFSIAPRDVSLRKNFKPQQGSRYTEVLAVT